MKQPALDSLGRMIEERKKRERYSGGEIFCWWGLVISLGILIQHWIVNFDWMYYVMNGVGALGQILYILYQRGKKVAHTYWDVQLFFFWGVMVLIIIVIPLVHVGHAGLFGIEGVLPIVYVLLGSGLYISGVFVSRYSLRIGGIVMIVAGILLSIPPFTRLGLWRMALCIGGMFIGFGVFGLLSNFEKTP